MTPPVDTSPSSRSGSMICLWKGGKLYEIKHGAKKETELGADGKTEAGQALVFELDLAANGGSGALTISRPGGALCRGGRARRAARGRAPFASSIRAAYRSSRMRLAIRA